MQTELTGTFREVNWITRTAQLYDDDGTMTTVRFTAEQDGWMKLVANIPVDLKGIYVAGPSDVSQNGQPAAAPDANCMPSQEWVQLTEVRVQERPWQPYALADLDSVQSDYVYNPDTHKPLSFHLDVDEFMRSVRGPDYEGSAP